LDKIEVLDIDDNSDQLMLWIEYAPASALNLDLGIKQFGRRAFGVFLHGDGDAA
jgi:hypothetical protein